MTDKESTMISDEIPKAKLKTREKSISPVWVIPIVAALMGGWLVFKGAIEENVFVEVTFESAAGLEAGKTPVKLRNVKVGELTEVKFSEDLSQVIVVMELTGVSRERLTDTTQFWVVKPRIGVEGVSGLDTLLSGAFIEIDPGEGGKPVKKFTGLEAPQIYQLGNPGTKYLLKSDKLGSLNRGSPVKYRGIDVGSVTRYKLVDDHSHVEIEVFIEAPHDKFVTDYSRFWNVSGLNVELGAKGFDFNMESIGSLLAGGIAFTNDNVPDESQQAKENNLYTLHDKEEPEIEEILTFGAPMKLYFAEGVSGLSVGAPVEYKGIRLGTVVEVGVEKNKEENNIITFAMIDIEPERLPISDTNEKMSHEKRIKNVYRYFDYMVEHGMRAQLKSNILTGQSLIVLDVFAGIDKKRVEYKTDFVVVPTVPETVTGIIKQVNELLSRLNSLPVESIVENLEDATKNLNGLIKSLNVEEGGMTGVQVNETMNELSKAAHSIRVMSEYLERHPEALLKGKTTK